MEDMLLTNLIGMMAGSGSVTLLVFVIVYFMQRHKLEDRAGTIQSLKDTIQRLQATIDKLQQDYTEIREKELADLKRRIDSHINEDKSPVLAEQLKAIVEALRKNGDDLRMISLQTSDLKADIAAVRAELKAKDGWIKGIEDKVSAISKGQDK
jgi:chromosome segregation ATPase